MIYMIPLLIFPLIAYNIFELFSIVSGWRQIIFDIETMSGGIFSINITEVFTLFCIFLLFFEIIKATRSSNRTVVDHLMSTLVFIICLVEFLLVSYAATSAFLILTIVSLVDVVAGYTVSIRTATRDVEFHN